MSVTVRPALASDAPVAAHVLRRSIQELCTADHQHDPDTLAQWLSNKTARRVGEWIASNETFMIVAELHDEIVGVGSIGRSGTITLCYVLPGQESRGVGAQMLAALETQAARWGTKRITLNSTVCARTFYERHGYVATCEATPGFGVTRCYPYEKVLPSGAMDTDFRM